MAESPVLHRRKQSSRVLRPNYYNYILLYYLIIIIIYVQPGHISVTLAPTTHVRKERDASLLTASRTDASVCRDTAAPIAKYVRCFVAHVCPVSMLMLCVDHAYHFRLGPRNVNKLLSYAYVTWHIPVHCNRHLSSFL